MASGPPTPTGKQTSSANSITHGCTSHKLILPDENEQDFENLKQGGLDDYRSETYSFRNLLIETAEAEWLLRRNARRYNQAEHWLDERERERDEKIAAEAKEKDRWKELLRRPLEKPVPCLVQYAQLHENRDKLATTGYERKGLPRW